LGHCHRNRKAAPTRQNSLREELDVLLDSRADDSAGTTKRRTLLSFYAVRTSAPTRASSPRQLPTDHDHAVPTREYQSDQSSRMLLGCRRPCCPKQNTLQAHQRERVPATPPVDWSWGARTVLAVKGSLRRAKRRRALDYCAPFRPDRYRDGRLRREHSAALHTSKSKRPASLLRRKAGLNKNKPVRPGRGLTSRSISEPVFQGKLHDPCCGRPFRAAAQPAVLRIRSAIFSIMISSTAAPKGAGWP
jgi:hypothetical protein